MASNGNVLDAICKCSTKFVETRKNIEWRCGGVLWR
jgi:hypothetical protein